MRRWALVTVLVWTAAARAQEPVEAPVSKTTWTTFVGLGAEFLADGVTTRVLYQRHHPEIDPLAKPFVNAGVPGQIGASLLGAGALSGAWFLLHRTHHDRAASWFLRSVIGGEGYNVARQAALLRTSQGNQDQAADRGYAKVSSQLRLLRRYPQATLRDRKSLPFGGQIPPCGCRIYQPQDFR